MAQMLQAPIEGYEDAIVVPPINANNFELKQPLINLVQSNKFTDGEARDWNGGRGDVNIHVAHLPLTQKVQEDKFSNQQQSESRVNRSEEFTDKSLLLTHTTGDDVSILKRSSKKDTFSNYTNPLFEFDDNFKSSNVNPLFLENDKDVEIKSSSYFTLTSPEESELEAYLERDSIPPGIDLSPPPPPEVSSSNPTSPTLTGEKDLKKDLAVAFDSTESSILPLPLLDSDSPFTAELSASFTLNSLENEDKVFKPGILVYHAIHDKNLVTLEKNLRENIFSGTLLFFKEPSFLLPPPEPPDEYEECCA
ncbi:hypothetical protein Tco_0538602 [Tanacetum coccineum]